ncbi:MAG: pyruvate kinase, partial [Gaiellales bacterium]|nr:pyruvate kinase [Gaiellales bacterium]
FIERMAWAGMDAARLNFSHGTRDDHLAVIHGVRRAQEVIGRPLAVIADLQGPKIRIGKLPEPRMVNVGDVIVLAGEGEGAAGDLEVTFAGLAHVVKPGAELLIDDGRVRVRVERIIDGRVECRVEVGSLISSGKGVNLPGTPLPIPSLTDKDIADLDFALGHGVDYVALSFVRSAKDVVDLRDRIATARSSARVMAKIEKAEAVASLEEIVAVSDAVMVARGDLGVEIGVADVPLVQKLIIRTARDAGRTVVTATQMLESMIHQPEPTRAEASDVANAVLDGSSGLMLSGETAVGRYPLEAVGMMNRIARVVEPSLGYHDPSLRRDDSMSAILCHAACDIAEELDSAVIAVPTQSGSTARKVSRFRPRRPIVAASPYPHVLQQLALDWAVVPIVVEDADSIEDLWHRIADAVADSGLAVAGDLVVITGGTVLNLPGTTNHILVHTME